MGYVLSLAARRQRSPLLLIALCACSGSAQTAPTRGSAANPGAGVAAPATASAAVPAASAMGNSSSSLIVPISMPVSNASSAGAGGAGMMKQSSGRDPIVIDDCAATNPAGVSIADAQALKAGGAAGGLQLVYPYEGTVFPRGLLAPELMWQGAAATAVYVHIKSKIFEYAGCLKPTAEGRLTLPQDVWDQAAARTFGKDDPYALELTVLSQGKVLGPVRRTLLIAQATIKGSIYYNSYSSQLAQGAANSGAAPGGGIFGTGPMGGLVLRIPAGGKAELFGQTGCNGCHSVSADGSRLLSQFVGTGGQSYELIAGGMAGTPVMAGMRGAFGALYPDGSAYLSGSSVVEVARSNMTSQGQLADATLHDAKSGAVIPAVGIPKGVLMPSLSPDGTYLAFNDYAIDAAHGLAIMKYDVKTHTASDYKILVQEPAAGMLRPGWPFVLPDNGAVVFVRTDGVDWSGDGAGVMMQAGGFGARPVAAPFSELSIIDVGSGKVSLLAKAMGYDTPDDAQSDKTYLPFGAEELHHNYFPTVSPVAAGGYFWVFFDSVRHYGVLGAGRQLWGAAVDISPDGTYTTDPSHPAFYLPGQELGTGNHRAFAALDPCRKDGDKCTSGIDCCGGFCYFEGPEEFDRIGSCTPKKMMCAKRDERCTQDSDCCPPQPGEHANTCIAGFCAFIPPLN